MGTALLCASARLPKQTGSSLMDTQGCPSPAETTDSLSTAVTRSHPSRRLRRRRSSSYLLPPQPLAGRGGGTPRCAARMGRKLLAGTCNPPPASGPGLSAASGRCTSARWGPQMSTRAILEANARSGQQTPASSRNSQCQNQSKFAG